MIHVLPLDEKGCSVTNEFFTDDQNMAELISHMPDEDRNRFNNYGHFRVEAVFIDRVFVVYRPTGMNAVGQHRDPEILTTIKVTDFGVEVRDGCYAVIENQQTGQEQTVRHVPRQLFNYPIYVSVPTRLMLRWDARMVNDRVWRSLSFALLIKTKNKADFYSKGNTYAETPNQFGNFYPGLKGTFDF